jgi:hypothetical protein
MAMRPFDLAFDPSNVRRWSVRLKRRWRAVAIAHDARIQDMAPLSQLSEQVRQTPLDAINAECDVERGRVLPNTF